LPRRIIPEIPAPPEVETIGARTEHLRIHKVDGAPRAVTGIGSVTWVEYLDDQDHLHIQLVDRDFVTLSDPGQGLAQGDEVVIGFIDPLFFDCDGARVRQ